MSFAHHRLRRLVVLFVWLRLGLAAAIFFPGLSHASETAWFISIYGGQIADNRLTQVLLDPRFADSRIAAFVVGRELFRREDILSVEVETQFIRHSVRERIPKQKKPAEAAASELVSDPSPHPGSQRHMEYNMALVLRFLKTPWDRFLHTGFALGEGVSYTTRIPPAEIPQDAVDHGLEYNASRFLNYLMIEMTLGVPSMDRWRLFYRIHHRSGVYGLINGVRDGSNFVGFGVRYQFE